MRLALISDIHGNPIALEAVLEDIRAQGGVDGYWFIGDYSALGYDPVTPLERVSALPNAVFVRGNTDRHITTDNWLDPEIAAALSEPLLIPKLVETARSFAWTQGCVTAAGWLEWLTALPVEQRLTLPDGTRLLAVHASPGTDEGPGFTPATTDAQLARLLEGCDADLVVVGHIHYPHERWINDIHVANIASVSNPVALDLRANYALLDADRSGYEIHCRRVEYDREAVMQHIRQSRHPAQRYLLNFFEGRYRPDWLKQVEHKLG